MGAGEEEIKVVGVGKAGYRNPLHEWGDVAAQQFDGRGAPLIESVGVRGGLDFAPAFANADRVGIEGVDLFSDRLAGDGKRFEVGLLERRVGEINAGFEEVLEQALGLRWLRFGVLLIEVIEVAPVIEDEEFGFVPARAEEVFREARTAADHLPELDARFDGLGEDEIDDLGHVDAGIEHVDGDGNGGVRFSFEVADELFPCGNLVIDHRAKGSAILRVHYVEELVQLFGVIVATGEDDGLAQLLAGCVADAVLHQVAQDLAVGVFVQDDFVEFVALVVEG